MKTVLKSEVFLTLVKIVLFIAGSITVMSIVSSL